MQAKTPSMRDGISSVTQALLLCGAVSGPLFVVAVVVQGFTVPGFDIRTDLISLLALGQYGFVQIANFTLCGVLNLLCAAGAWRRLHGGPSGTFAPIFIALHGLLLVVVGVFVTDPANGFPPGAVTPTTPSTHGIIHAGGALWVFVTCAAALAVLVPHFLATKDRWWAAYCGASAVLMLAIFFASFTLHTSTAPFLDVSLVIGWMGISVVAAKLLAEPAGARQAAARE
ncbi:MAG: DUF998 domain-containing protein [Candidatus Dormibacteraeota bacterium]|nr:DUF998 domain-containing protein [Candidatus Dormibacteraeota bacterium]